MDATSLVALFFIATGGIMAATYEIQAQKVGLPVGHYFTLRGPVTILGAFAAIAAFIASWFLFYWFVVPALILLAIYGASVLFSVFRVASQILSFLMMLGGTITLLFHVLS